MKKQIITRRDFMKATSKATAGGALLLGASAPTPLCAKPKPSVKVVLIRNKDVLDASLKPKPEIVTEMLDQAVAHLTNQANASAAWKKIVKPSDIVGIKSNVWQYIPTTEAVEESLKKRIVEAGVKSANVSVDDRGVLKNPVFQKATALINARPMRTHHWSGVGSLIKNYIMFSPNPSSYHPDSCADLAALWQEPIVKNKTRLNVLVMLTPQFHGVGPHNFNPKYVWNYCGFIVGFDPVAVDATGLRIIQAKRKAFFGESRPLNPPAKHILLADNRHHLGTADTQKIELVRLGYDKDTLI